MVRKRPLGKKETGNIIEVHPQLAGMPACLTLHEPKLKVDMTAYIESHKFAYDDVFDEGTSNRSVYEATAAPLISRVFTKGQTSTCFAYGATGAGKTHTMMGTEAEPGLYLLAAADLFSALETPEHAHLQLHVASFEIYGGKVFDLLNNRDALPVREDGKKKINIVGLREAHVPNMDAFREKIREAQNARQTAATIANADSSRSHAILQLSLKRAKGQKGMPSSGAAAAMAAAAAASEARGGGAAAGVASMEEVGRFSFIDLAGTERGADTLNCENKERRAEGAEINKSLLALKECIRGLDSGKTHIPFRGSKLTEVLRDSFIGDCHTVMIGAVAPCIASIEPTLNTLRYTNLVRAFSSSTVSAVSAAASSASASTATPAAASAPLAPLHEESAAADPPPPPMAETKKDKAPTARGLRPPQAVGPRGRRGSVAMSKEAQANADAAVAAANASVAAAVAAARVSSAPPPPPPPPPPSDENDALNRPSTDSNASFGLLSPLLTTLQGAKKSLEGEPPPPPPPEAPVPPAASPAPLNESSDATKRPSESKRPSLPFGNFFGLLGGGGAAAAAAEVQGGADDFTCPPPAAALNAEPMPADATAPEPEVGATIGVRRPSKARKEAWKAHGDEKPKALDEARPLPVTERSASDANVTAPSAPPAAAKDSARPAAPTLDKKVIAKAGVAVFDAHRTFISSCVEQLEMHTFLLQHAENQPVDKSEELDEYVRGLDALLRERQAALSALQAQLQTFRCTIGSASGGV